MSQETLDLIERNFSTISLIRENIPTAKLVEPRQANTVSLEADMGEDYAYFHISIVEMTKSKVVVCFTYKHINDHDYSQPTLDVNENLEQDLKAFVNGLLTVDLLN